MTHFYENRNAHKSANLILSLIIFTGVLSLFSCKSQEDLYKRKYTEGQYSDFNFHREKGRKESSADSTVVIAATRIIQLEKPEIPKLASLKMLNVDSGLMDTGEMFHEQYPVFAAKLDSVIENQMRGDTSWIHDTLPDAIETALSGQAMVGVGTFGGLITIAAPEAIWFTIIPMIGIPFFLVISLIAAGIAFGKINRGEIDAKYKGAMRLWAICLVINLILGSILLMHYVML